MYAIFVYILGFVLCLIGNLLDSYNEDDRLGILFWTLNFVLSPFTTPMMIGLLLLLVIGLLINYLTRLLDKTISKILG
jgi:hypothetical protein